VTIDWTLPVAGDYILTARADALSGPDIETLGILVHVSDVVPEPEEDLSEGNDAGNGVIDEEEPPPNLNPFE